MLLTVNTSGLSLWCLAGDQELVLRLRETSHHHPSTRGLLGDVPSIAPVVCQSSLSVGATLLGKFVKQLASGGDCSSSSPDGGWAFAPNQQHTKSSKTPDEKRYMSSYGTPGQETMNMIAVTSPLQFLDRLSLWASVQAFGITLGMQPPVLNQFRNYPDTLSTDATPLLD
jgi:hypothetical protein